MHAEAIGYQYLDQIGDSINILRISSTYSLTNFKKVTASLPSSSL